MNKTQRAIVEVTERGYKVTKDGKVISPKGIFRKFHLNSNSPKCTGGSSRYYRFSFVIAGVKSGVQVMVHRLIGYQKFGMRIFEKDIQVRHLDDNSLNNCWDNIGIGTRSENSRDSLFRYSDHLIMQMAKERKSGATYAQIARNHDAPCATVWGLLNKTQYAKVILQRMAS